MITFTFTFLALFAAVVCEFSCPRRCECDGVAVVDCSGLQLTRISTDGFDIDTKKIVLSNNFITSLDASVFDKTNVRVLRRVMLDHNRISHVDPEAFFGQSELEEVDLSHNALTSLTLFPFRRCWRLQRLVLSHNPLHTLDATAPPPAFAELYLDHCALTHVLSEEEPAGGAPGLARVRLDRLRRLQVEGNPLRCDCRQLATYRRLERLRLARDANCGDSPDSFWQSVLERIDCSPCPQNCTCPAHSVANCSSAGLQEVPTQDFNHTATTIVLSNNSIERIDKGVFAAANVTAAETVLLDHNLVWLLDEGAFSGLVRLRRLDLSHNALPGLSDRMLERASLSGLEWLSLSHNRLSHVAADAFAGLSNLRSLDLSHNRLTTLSPEVFSGTTPALASLSVASNALLDLSWTANASASLRELDASDNRIETVTAAEVAALPDLGALHLSGNPLRCDSSLLPALRALESLALARDTRCHSPARLRGKFWQNLDRHSPQPAAATVSCVPQQVEPRHELKIPPQVQVSSYNLLIGVIAGLILALVTVVFLCVLYRNRRHNRRIV